MKYQADNEYEQFAQKLASYKQIIDQDIDEYSNSLRQNTLASYGEQAKLEVDAFLDILARGGKRLRGGLVMLGYEMSGGQDLAVAVQAARAIEMVHAHMLIVDDIQDRSEIRRGGPAGHVLLADYHRKHHLAGSAEHFGIAVAMDSGLTGTYAAQNILAELDVDPNTRLKILCAVNDTVITTAHGQTSDIMNEMLSHVTVENIKRVLEWKSAQYTVLNPLCVGMLLAGADDEAIEAIRDYAIGTGMAFQIGDDVLSTFSDTDETGKTPMDDMREGKRTLMIAYALQHAPKADQNYLLQVLGDPHMTLPQFDRAREILESCGARLYAESEMSQYVASAIASLEHEASRWTPDGVDFLRSFANYMVARRS